MMSGTVARLSSINSSRDDPEIHSAARRARAVFTADLLDELGEIVTVTSGDQKRAVTKQRAIVDVLVSKALKGDAHASATIIGSCARALGEQYVDDEAEAPEDRAIIRAVAAPPAKNFNRLPTNKSMEDNNE